MDGRGGPTSLASLVPEHYGLRDLRQVMEAIYFERMSEERLAELVPVVFHGAREGDEIAGSIIDRQADEVATMAAVAIKDLRLGPLDVEVVLGGGVFRNEFPPFLLRIEERVRRAAADARISVLSTTPPIVGAALLGLDRIGAEGDAARRVRAVLTHDRLTQQT
jgi:N-acetylglucosamine kinase-like BadF-type ATPase